MRQYLKRYVGGPDAFPLPSAEWCNTINRFLETFRPVMWDGAYPYIDRTDPGARNWTLYIPSSSTPPAFPWQCYQAGGNLYVRPGHWTRNHQHRVTLSGAPTSPVDLGAVAASKWVYLQLDTVQAPTVLTVESADTVPPLGSTDGSGERYRTHILGYTDGDGVWVQLWWGGDIEDHYQYPVTWEGDPCLSATDGGPPQPTPRGAVWCEDEDHTPYMDFFWDGPTPKVLLYYYRRPIDVDDGRLDVAAYNSLLSVGADLSTFVSGLNIPTTETIEGVVSDWMDSNGKTWVEANIAHADLSDMPDLAGTETSHDARYWMHAGTVEGAADDRDYFTSGDLQAGSFAIAGSATNAWDSDFKADVTTATLKATTLALDPTGALTMNGKTGRTVAVGGFDPNTGESVLLTFQNGVLITP